MTFYGVMCLLVYMFIDVFAFTHFKSLIIDYILSFLLQDTVSLTQPNFQYNYNKYLHMIVFLTRISLL